ACDADADNDGQPNTTDPCPTDATNSCAAAGTDTDTDGVPDVIDNCPTVSNSQQENLDGDKVGDACDFDVDGDGIQNADDICPRDSANLCQAAQPVANFEWRLAPKLVDANGDGLLDYPPLTAAGLANDGSVTFDACSLSAAGAGDRIAFYEWVID